MGPEYAMELFETLKIILEFDKNILIYGCESVESIENLKVMTNILNI